ncbi:hypothetical protein FRC01_008187, partial [Tulasnella sp. 417]
LNASRVELWDLGHPFTSTPTTYFDGLDDLVDGHKLLQSSADSSVIALSVRSYKTYHIQAVLPQIGVETRQNPQLGLLYVVAGCSGLLDANKDLALYSRSPSKAGVIVQCQHSAATTILQSEKEGPILDYAPSAKIMTHFVIAVRRTGIELYSVDAIRDSLGLFGQKVDGTNQVFPTQVIPYPGGQHILRATFLNTPLHWVGHPYSGTDVVYIGLDTDSEAEPTRGIHAIYPNTSDGAGYTFTLSPPQRMLNSSTCVGYDPTVLCMWGETGRRMAHVRDERELCVWGLSIPVGFGAGRSLVLAEDRRVARWEIPDSSQDLARYLAFDEATGVCAVALGSGRIWIADPVRGTEFRDADIPIKEIEFSNPPDDSMWASKCRNPWPGDMSYPRTLRRPLLPRMSTKINRWFPGKNNPKAFGSVTWFVNEVLHIPGRAAVLLVGTSHPQDSPLDRFDIVDINGRLLCIERDDGMSLYDIKLLDTHITLQVVVAHLNGGGWLSDLAGTTVAVDGFALSS